jgi:hypothetical protein
VGQQDSIVLVCLALTVVSFVCCIVSEVKRKHYVDLANEIQKRIKLIDEIVILVQQTRTGKGNKWMTK